MLGLGHHAAHGLQIITSRRDRGSAGGAGCGKIRERRVSGEGEGLKCGSVRMDLPSQRVRILALTQQKTKSTRLQTILTALPQKYKLAEKERGVRATMEKERKKERVRLTDCSSENSVIKSTVAVDIIIYREKERKG